MKVEWDGTHVAACSFGLTPQEFVLDCRVEDTDVKINETVFWESSSITRLAQGCRFHYCGLLPLARASGPGTRRLSWSMGNASTAWSAPVRVDKSGYSFSLRADLEALEISPLYNPFLMEVVNFHRRIGSTSFTVTSGNRGREPTTSGSIR